MTRDEMEATLTLLGWVPWLSLSGDYVEARHDFWGALIEWDKRRAGPYIKIVYEKEDWASVRPALFKALYESIMRLKR